jgi:serine O-acetyltransferase
LRFHDGDPAAGPEGRRRLQSELKGRTSMSGMNELRRHIPAIVEAIVETYDPNSGASHHLSGHPLPDREEIAAILTHLMEILYPGYYGPREMTDQNVRYYVGERIDRLASRLSREVYRGLNHRCQESEEGADCDKCWSEADRITGDFLAGLPALRRMLAKDVQAGLDGDPAATGLDEIIFCYPGLRAITIFRVAHLLHTLGAPIIPRIMTELAHSSTGVDIHPGATIGESFFIDHGTGVVVGETTEIGKRVRLYQGVTLGALSLSAEETKSLRGHKRHPTIEDDAVIYANATILGGGTVIGKGAVIGGNCFVTRSVPAGTKVVL